MKKDVLELVFTVFNIVISFISIIGLVWFFFIR